MSPPTKVLASSSRSSSTVSMSHEHETCLICSKSIPISSDQKYFIYQRIKKATKKIFKDLFIPDKNFSKLIKANNDLWLGYCDSCMKHVQKISELQTASELLELKIQHIVGKLGKHVLKTSDAISSSVRRDSIVWSSFKQPVVQNFLLGQLPHPSVKLMVNPDVVYDGCIENDKAKEPSTSSKDPSKNSKRATPIDGTKSVQSEDPVRNVPPNPVADSLPLVVLKIEPLDVLLNEHNLSLNETTVMSMEKSPLPKNKTKSTKIEAVTETKKTDKQNDKRQHRTIAAIIPSIEPHTSQEDKTEQKKMSRNLEDTFTPVVIKVSGSPCKKRTNELLLSPAIIASSGKIKRRSTSEIPQSQESKVAVDVSLLLENKSDDDSSSRNPPMSQSQRIYQEDDAAFGHSDGDDFKNLYSMRKRKINQPTPKGRPGPASSKIKRPIESKSKEKPKEHSKSQNNTKKDVIAQKSKINDKNNNSKMKDESEESSDSDFDDLFTPVIVKRPKVDKSPGPGPTKSKDSKEKSENSPKASTFTINAVTKSESKEKINNPPTSEKRKSSQATLPEILKRIQFGNKTSPSTSANNRSTPKNRASTSNVNVKRSRGRPCKNTHQTPTPTPTGFPSRRHTLGAPTSIRTRRSSEQGSTPIRVSRISGRKLSENNSTIANSKNREESTNMKKFQFYKCPEPNCDFTKVICPKKNQAQQKQTLKISLVHHFVKHLDYIQEVFDLGLYHYIPCKDSSCAFRSFVAVKFSPYHRKLALNRLARHFLVDHVDGYKIYTYNSKPIAIPIPIKAAVQEFQDNEGNAIEISSSQKQSSNAVEEKVNNNTTNDNDSNTTENVNTEVLEQSLVPISSSQVPSLSPIPSTTALDLDANLTSECKMELQLKDSPPSVISDSSDYELKSRAVFLARKKIQLEEIPSTTSTTTPTLSELKTQDHPPRKNAPLIGNELEMRQKAITGGFESENPNQGLIEMNSKNINNYFRCQTCDMPSPADDYEALLDHNWSHLNQTERSIAIEGGIDVPKVLREFLIQQGRDFRSFHFSEKLVAEIIDYQMSVDDGQFYQSGLNARTVNCRYCHYVEVALKPGHLGKNTAKKNMIVHFLQEHFKRSQICKLCGQGFSDEEFLNRHYKIAH